MDQLADEAVDLHHAEAEGQTVAGHRSCGSRRGCNSPAPASLTSVRLKSRDKMHEKAASGAVTEFDANVPDRS